MFAFAAAGAAVADWFHSTGLAFPAEVGLVIILVGDFETELSGQLEIDWLALKAKLRFMRLFAL